MADNTALNPGAGGDTVRTIDRSLDLPPGGASKTQVVQLDVGGEAVESLVTGQNPMPIGSQDISALLVQILLTLQSINLQIGTLILPIDNIKPSDLVDTIL